MRQTWGSNTLDFFYDESGHPYALTYNGTTYYYVTNLQGDVLAILDGNKQVVASYTYDPYGKVLSATGTLAEVNPLRYRGYVYDSETGFYYLQSRYYDPTIGRFINADSYVSTGQGFLGHNMFAYCRNNPASRKDTLGTTDHATPDDDTDLLDEKKAYEGGKVINSDHSDSQGKGGSGQVRDNGSRLDTLYRAVSPEEAESATTTQSFSSGGNSYVDGKFFATSYNDAKKWGDFMYKDGNYRIIKGTFRPGVTAGSGVLFYSWHDGIGPAYLIPISELNASLIMITCV